ncbi:MAG: hypothetical protein J6M16_00100 [Clostridia bacterium]|nr:hypothetical protein [Clostridia bacterium]
MLMYGDFARKKVDLSALGFLKYKDENRYFCTPVGSKILYNAGVDGIHLVKIKAFGEMIFIVSPCADAPRFVHPVAESFEDLLRLIISGCDFAALEQAYIFTREGFYGFLKENEYGAEQKAVCEKLKEKFDLTPIDDPYAYIKNLQNNFDYGKIKYNRDYYEWAPEEPDYKETQWKVYFKGNLNSKRPKNSKEHKGKEFAVNKSLDFMGKKIFIPSFYLCSKGIVLDLIAECDTDAYKEFYEKYCFYNEYEPDEETRLNMERENPLNLNFSNVLYINGEKTLNYSSVGASYLPESEDYANYNEPFIHGFLKHYELDSNKSYIIRRFSFEFKGNKKPVIKDLNLKFKSDPVSYPVEKITVPDEKEISFTNPKTKAKHTLKILSCENESFPINFRDELSYPDKALLVNYTVSPDFESRALSLIDTKRSDQPKRIKKEKYAPEATHDAVIGIIGGADGPTAISVSRPIKKEAEIKSHQAVSSLHFSEVKSAEFRLVLSLNDNMEDEIKLY